MPTYEYACTDCGHEFEEFQTITAKPIRKCPKCAKRKVKRLISGGAGLLFKGSGFYITDYRSEGYRKAEKKDKEASSSKKSDAKKDKSKKKSKGKKEAA